MTPRAGGPILVRVNTRNRLNARVERAMESHGMTREQLVEKLPVGIRTLQARFKGTAQWTLDELEVLADLFFVGNFGAMLNESEPIQDQLREKIAEEVDRAVARALARERADASPKGAALGHKKRAAS